MLKRLLVCRNVAERTAEKEMWRRVGVKATAYLRGHALANDVGLTPTEKASVGVCDSCVKSSTPHLHVFGSVVQVTHFDTPHDAALAVAASHTFRRMGSPVVWSRKRAPRDYKDRRYHRWVQTLAQAARLADKYAKARHLLQCGDRKARVRACETLGLDVGQHAHRELWKDALLHRRTGKVKVRKVRKNRTGTIQTYRCAEV